MVSLFTTTCLRVFSRSFSSATDQPALRGYLRRKSITAWTFVEDFTTAPPRGGIGAPMMAHCTTLQCCAPVPANNSVFRRGPRRGQE
jgi:hypothetical protein